MKNFVAWQEMPITARLKVYDAYVRDSVETDGFGFGIASFEEYDAMCHNSGFYAIANLHPSWAE